jgi:hypothetical protein
VKETRLELENLSNMKIREVYRPRGLLAFTTAARDYVRIL